MIFDFIYTNVHIKCKVVICTNELNVKTNRKIKYKIIYLTSNLIMHRKIFTGTN